MIQLGNYLNSDLIPSYQTNLAFTKWTICQYIYELIFEELTWPKSLISWTHIIME
jgi:hypothetical protein